LLRDGEHFALGGLGVQVLHTPGHTPARVTYVIGDCAIVGDTLFMPDYGTARADFPGGDAGGLYRSIRRILDLPNETCFCMCPDYAPGDREPAWETTVAEQRRDNVQVCDGVDEAQFIRKREARDRSLDMPSLILSAVQVNIRAGRFPKTESNGVCYLKIPINVLN